MIKQDEINALKRQNELKMHLNDKIEKILPIIEVQNEENFQKMLFQVR